MKTAHGQRVDDNRSGDSSGLRPGDHLRAGWPGSFHHDAIYLGNGDVVHLSGADKPDARVRIDPLAVFAAGRPVTVRPYSGTQDRDAIIARALSQVDTGGYHLLFNNCQHFARWCVTGDHVSEQVDAVISTAGAAVTPAAAASLGISLVASAGLVSGLSGPGIMSGLASFGKVFSGGAMDGMLTLSTVPGVAGVAIMRRALREDEDLPESERSARTAGRWGAAAGAIAGVIGGAVAVSALGVPGLAAPGISSGLARVGKPFGGGMAAGTMAIIAAPAVGAAVFGYLTYRVTLWWLQTVGRRPAIAVPEPR